MAKWLTHRFHKPTFTGSNPVPATKEDIMELIMDNIEYTRFIDRIIALREDEDEDNDR